MESKSKRATGYVKDPSLAGVRFIPIPHAPRQAHASFLDGSAVLPLALAHPLSVLPGTSGTSVYPAREIPAVEVGGCVPKRHEAQDYWSDLK